MEDIVLRRKQAKAALEALDGSDPTSKIYQKVCSLAHVPELGRLNRWSSRKTDQAVEFQ